MAHICTEKSGLGSNRHDPSQNPAERDDYENLILLCPNHHTLIDKPENEDRYSVDSLKAMKMEHENFVNGRLEKLQFANKKEVAAYLYPRMKENHEVFTNFGPHSEIARKNPESDAHGIWLSERLGTIIPNNRRMLNVIEANIGFRTEELTFDHIVPKSRGGRTIWDNVVTACEPCNLKKGHRSLRQSGMRLWRLPGRPTNFELRENGRAFPPNFLHQSWRDFLYWDTELESG